MTDSPERAIDPVEELRTSIRQFVQYVEAIPHDLWLTKIVNWTPRDIVAHLIGWNVCMLEGCELMRAGKAPTYLNDREHDYRHVNAASVDRYAARDRATLLSELEASFRGLEQYLTGLEAAAWGADTGIRLGGRPVTIRGSIRALARDYDHHRQRLAEWRSGL